MTLPEFGLERHTKAEFGFRTFKPWKRRRLIPPANLRLLNWRDVLNCSDVNTSFSLFWQDFKALYDIQFPLKTVKLNKNLHGINKFMTKGLLTSRLTKIKLLKLSAKLQTSVASEAFRKYRNI